MRKLLILIFAIGAFSLQKAQKIIIFQYDEAGNQVLRTGKSNNAFTNNKHSLPFIADKVKTEEDLFWEKIDIYPVPVKDVLTLRWQSETRDLIADINLYEHNSLSNLYTYKILNTNNIEINMRGFRRGVYILSFTLNDGKTYYRNIVKE